MIKSGGGFERAVAIEREEGIVVFSINKVVSDRIPIRIGGIEFAHDGAYGLVLGNGKISGGVEIVGWLTDLLKTDTEAKVADTVVGTATWLRVAELRPVPVLFHPPRKLRREPVLPALNGSVWAPVA